MTKKEKIEKIFNFIHKQGLSVISTVDLDEKKPESALVAFTEKKNLELFFGTHFDSRKYQNLKSNTHVSFVIGWDLVTHVTVQYEGEAIELPGSEIVEWQEIFKEKKTPFTATFLKDPKMRFFKVTPVWVALSDYTKSTPDVIEVFFP